jgi:hypothetical protein
MNELQRQHYLSVLGVDTYMPRWHLPYAPVSIVCKLPAVLSDEQAQTIPESKLEISVAQTSPIQTYKQTSVENVNSSLVNNLIGDIFNTQKSSIVAAKPISAADILAQLDAKPVSIEGFSLSIWRPVDGVVIVDTRNTKLALPTELLLNNILRVIFKNNLSKLQEEVLRWPMIENSFTKRTANDARIELQTWLSVQHEIRPIKYLWLMGANATSYLLHEEITHQSSLFKITNLADSAIKALILPSLNELLQSPRTKQKLFSAIRQYHSVSQ